MNPWIAYVAGVATLPSGWLLIIGFDTLKDYLRREWIDTVDWNRSREWKRWQWSDAGRYLSFTPKHWPRRGIAVNLRPWRPKVPPAPGIEPWEPPEIGESYNVPVREFPPLP